MPPEDTDLERRVLAHEQILQALLAALGDRDPGLLKIVIDRFSGSRHGAHEQDFSETADYAAEFVHEIGRLQRAGTEFGPMAEATSPREQAFHREPLSPSDKPVSITGIKRGGIWRITSDQRFVGDYFEPRSALRAAVALAHEVARRDGTAEVTFAGESVTIPALPAQGSAAPTLA